MASTISIRRTHNLEPDQAQHLVESLATELKDSLSLSYRWEGRNLTFKRRGANGNIQIGDQDINVEVNLSFVLMPLKGKIQREITTYFDKYL